MGEPGKGLGLCVFTSIQYAAWWQDVRVLHDLQSKMKTQKGGGWPEKVDQVLGKSRPRSSTSSTRGRTLP